MNAPLPDSIRKALETVSLDDKYALDTGRAFMSGVQALVRLPMLQRTRDALAGLNTAGFISGYRGSPLGGYDQALWSAKKHLAAQNIVFQPGINEELGATAVWGTQQLALYPQTNKFDGVFGLWYGKGPGVDRTADVFKHANMAGTSAHGGVIAIAGDDHVSKSSTAAHQSDHIFKACGMPVFFPSSVQDILDMGLHAFAMSRFSGVWTSMKTIQEVVESSSTVDVDPHRVDIVLPEDFVMPTGGLHIRWPDPPLEQEARLMDFKWYAALAYVRANKLNHNVIATPNDRFGLIASGKAYNDLRQALADLGLDDDTCRSLGIRLHKVNVVWPLEATITRDFAQGLKEILVVEEKRQMIEYQLKEQLYNWRNDVRPTVLGKFDEQEGDLSGGEWSNPNPGDNWLLRPKADLTPAIIAKAVARRLKKLGVPDDIVRRMDERIAVIEAKDRALVALKADTAGAVGDRTPWFCSGCPHNTSTVVPEGSRALGGIGCHYMVTWMDRKTDTFTHMGGEGVTWSGQAPFTDEKHVFQNLGDGTYFHSGSLAIRQSIAAKVNITYKILYNDAVAMTGGQPVDGTLTVPDIAHQVRSEGVQTIVVMSDEIEKWSRPEIFPAGVEFIDRDELDHVQKRLRDVAGVSVLIFDQTCAAEKRRRRKRGKMPDPAKRAFINAAVCEGCGDCGVKSNCVSILPLETELGRKREIDQNNCNKDFSCVKGFCPSFVTVHGGGLRKRKGSGAALDFSVLPMPVAHTNLDRPWNILVTGIGGTGVVTIGALIGMAAHLEGKGTSVLDQTGLAQKGGAVTTHVRVARAPEDIHAVRIAAGEADLVLGCDMVVVNDYWALSKIRADRTTCVLNTYEAMPGTFTRNADMVFPSGAIVEAVKQGSGGRAPELVDATELSIALLGDSIATNTFMLGYAWQKGMVPVSLEALMRAIELNGAAIEMNKKAFDWGRMAAHDMAAVQKAAGARTAPAISAFVDVGAATATAGGIAKSAATAAAFEGFGELATGLDESLALRVKFLTEYQDAGYAARYRAFVETVRAAESSRAPGMTGLAEAVARYLFKLMAIKDEFEVARLYTTGDFEKRIRETFDGDYKIHFNLAPPLFAKKDADGHLRKAEYGPWVFKAFKVLAWARRFRGGMLDVFGRTAERRMERQLIVDYRASIEELIAGLNPGNHALAVEIAAIPEHIRGYGHVKEAHLHKARARWDELLAMWRAPVEAPALAA